MNDLSNEIKDFEKEFYKHFFEALATDESGCINELLYYLLINANILKKETEQYQKDYSKYKTGVFLWFQELYPHLCEFLIIFSKSDFFLQIPTYSGMKDIVVEFYNFIENIKNNQPELFKEEFNDSKKFFFYKTIQPIKILLKKNSLINLIYNEFSINFNEIFPNMTENLKKNSEKFSEYLNSYIEEVLPFIVKNLEAFLKLLKKQIIEIQYQQILDENLKKIEEVKSNYETITKNFVDEINIQKIENKDKMESFTKKMEELRNLISKAYTIDVSHVIYDYIILLKDIDSYNIQFSKFLHRLYDILIYGNRDYINNPECFYLVKPQKYDFTTRNKLKKFLKKKLFKISPKLSNFILSYFGYNQFRKIEAHEIPDGIQLSNDGKYALIPTTGNELDIKMDIELTKKAINTYCFFIDSLGIY